ncbi:uncharacterized protein LOC128709205 [Anopheles marshallii]|uniref:uncharacterized protein LOC128709205 n=1 Tax=Anopheles marshallii TaxID=1521116 RepID=UPI00237B999D|nr:uncharacterized protein LOC128709205 [Anopheles marshallii]
MKQQHRTAAGVGFLCCLTFALTLGAPQQAGTIEKHDPDDIRTIVTDLLATGISIYLDEHQIRFIKGDTENLLLENFLFATEDGFLFTLSTEKAFDKSYKPKVVSYFDPSEDDAQKVLLSLLGGGRIKTLTVQKAR